MCGLGMTIKHRDTMSDLGHSQMQAVASREKALQAPCNCPVPFYRSWLGTEPTHLQHGPQELLFLLWTPSGTDVPLQQLSLQDTVCSPSHG